MRFKYHHTRYSILNIDIHGCDVNTRVRGVMGKPSDACMLFKKNKVLCSNLANDLYYTIVRDYRGPFIEITAIAWIGLEYLRQHDFIYPTVNGNKDVLILVREIHFVYAGMGRNYALNREVTFTSIKIISTTLHQHSIHQHFKVLLKGT